MAERSELETKVSAGAFLVELFDRIADIVVFVKDREARYVAMNETLVRRLGLHDKAQALGRTTREVFPAPLGDRYLEQDMGVFRTGEPILDFLELHLYPDRHEGWCLTNKVLVHGARGEVIGLAGASRDVHRPDLGTEPLDDLAKALRLIHERFDKPLRVDDLAVLAGMSVYQFSRRIRKLFNLTPAQLIIKTRIEASCRMLQEGHASIADVALACGYCDQSAFTRQFKAVVGMPPAKYREHYGRR